MNIKILVVLCILISGCSYQDKSDPNQDRPNQGEHIKDTGLSEPLKGNIDVSDTHHNTAKSSSNDLPATAQPHQAVICVDQNVNDWYGFNTKELDEATCNQISSYSIKEYQCAVSGKAFGADMDAMNIQTKGATIFTYRTLEQCNEAKDIFGSNAP